MEEMNLIYGSCAVKHWFPEFRDPNDVDYIGKDAYWVPSFQYVLDRNTHPQYLDPNFIYTIKISHSSWDIWWDKTMHDIIFLKNKGCELDYEFYNMLYSDWSIVHGKKKTDFSGKTKDFFKENITRKIDHDLLHEMLAFYDRPLHERIRKDQDSPLCSRELFDALSYEDKLKCALEEIHVIATERFILNGVKSLKHAKYKSLKTLITSASSGWFCLFIVLNFDTLIYYEVETWQRKLQENGLIDF